MSRHGIFVEEEATALTVPTSGTSGLQVVIGTAPVNMAENPEKVVNVPFYASKATEAMKELGYCKDFKNYTLCKTMYITSNVYEVSPVVYINVLDPKKHNKAMEEQIAAVEAMQAVIKQIGVLQDDSLTVKVDSETLEKGTDYTLSFDSDGYLVVTMIAGGKGENANSVTVNGNILAPEKVTKDDIIGSYDIATGKETGMETIRQIYPLLGVVPGTLIAPGWSHIPEVGIALSAKAANINGVFQAMALIDLDTSKAKKYTECKKVKEDSGFTSENCWPLWPHAKIGDLEIEMSAIMAAKLAYTDANNDDVPSASPSNKMVGITGLCLEDGTDVILDQDQASVVEEAGVGTAINANGWRAWGNYTGCYPGDSDAKNIWVNVRRMFMWQANTFIQTYFEKVDDNMNAILIESIVDSENIRCASYAPEKWAGASIEYREEDNPETDIIAGKITFRQSIAPYTPAKEIKNILTYDTTMLKDAITNGGE